MEQEIQDILNREFKPEDINKDHGGFEYVKPHLIIGRLNEAMPGEWAYQLEERIVTDDEIIQFGKVGRKDDSGEWVWRSNCGGKQRRYYKDAPHTPENYVNVINDYKSAVSNCLKRCAMLWGVALHLYGETEQSDEDGNKLPQNRQDAPQEPRGDKGAGNKGQPASPGSSAEGGKPSSGDEDPREQAIELQKAYMIEHGVSDKATRLHFLGTEDLPKGLNAWTTYRDLMAPLADDKPGNGGDA